MKQSVTQEFEYGCGVACFAFALDISYEQAATLVGPEQATSARFWIKDFVQALNANGKAYSAKYVKPRLRSAIYNEGTIVLIRRSKRYPTGHYLIRHAGYWMDPWINMRQNDDIKQAKSGFRKRLPGSPMYALFTDTHRS